MANATEASQTDAAGRPLVEIDFVSDVACPWCVIGLRSLLLALQDVSDEMIVELRLQPFELNPDMQPEGENVADHVRRKYGSSAERSEATRDAIRQGGEGLGFHFNYSPDTRIWNTFDAHRLLHWAGLKGEQIALKQALFAAQFTRQLNPGDPAVLISAASEVGLDTTEAATVVSSNAYADEVRQEEQFWRDQGINAVPSVVLCGRWLLQGAQGPEQYAAALRQVAKAMVSEQQKESAARG